MLGAEVMDGLGEDFFAGAAFPLQQDVGGRRGGERRQADGVADRRAVADDVFELQGRRVAAEAVYQALYLLDGPQDDDAAGDRALIVDDGFARYQAVAEAVPGVDHHFDVSVWFGDRQGFAFGYRPVFEQLVHRRPFHVSAEQRLGRRVEFDDDFFFVDDDYAVGHGVEEVGQPGVDEGQFLVFPPDAELGHDGFGRRDDYPQRVQMGGVGCSRHVEHADDPPVFVEDRRGRTGKAVVLAAEVLRPGYLERRPYLEGGADGVGAGLRFVPAGAAEEVFGHRVLERVFVAEHFHDEAVLVGEDDHEPRPVHELVKVGHERFGDFDELVFFAQQPVERLGVEFPVGGRAVGVDIGRAAAPPRCDDLRAGGVIAGAPGDEALPRGQHGILIASISTHLGHLPGMILI